MNNQIEISQDIILDASIHFWIDREEWEAMTDEQKRAYIADKIDTTASRFSNECIAVDGSVNMSAGVIGPNNADIDLEKVGIYDPNE